MANSFVFNKKPGAGVQEEASQPSGNQTLVVENTEELRKLKEEL